VPFGQKDSYAPRTTGGVAVFEAPQAEYTSRRARGREGGFALLRLRAGGGLRAAGRFGLLLHTDGLAGDDELDAPVLCAACGGAVVGLGVVFTETGGGDVSKGHALRDKEVAYGLGTIL
jgi:hypothetical protein